MAEQKEMTDAQRLEALQRERAQCVADEPRMAQQRQMIESSYIRSIARFPDQPEDMERRLAEAKKEAEAKMKDFELKKTALDKMLEAQTANIATNRFPLGPGLHNAYLMTMRALSMPQILNAVNASMPDLLSYPGWVEIQETVSRTEQEGKALKAAVESLVCHAQSLSSDFQKLAEKNEILAAVATRMVYLSEKVESSEAKVTELTNANTALSQDETVLQQQVDESTRIINELRAENERLKAGGKGSEYDLPLR